MKFKITHIESNLFVIWEEESLEKVEEILQKGHRQVLAVRGNSPHQLTIENTIIEEIKS